MNPHQHQPAVIRGTRRRQINSLRPNLAPRLISVAAGLAFGLALLGVQVNLTAQTQPSADYTFTTLAGYPRTWGSTDGAGSQARFYWPRGLAVDGAGNVYVADTYNNTIRKITPEGVVSTLAGLAGTSGSADGAGSQARFSGPAGIALDGAGNAYVADAYNNTIRKVTPDGSVTTLAGLAGSSGSADGAGGQARFGNPTGVAVDPDGNVYVADTYNDTIRKITPAGVVSTLAGQPGAEGSADGAGSQARFYWPSGVAVDRSGNIYVADRHNDTIRKVTPAGVVTTLAGRADTPGFADGADSEARFFQPDGVAVDDSGNVYVADTWNETIRKITPAGVVTTLAGLSGVHGSADGTAGAARFFDPQDMAVNENGNLYVADMNNSTIRVGISPSCPDRPTVDLPAAPPGVIRHLDTSPQTAVAWQWSLDQAPPASSATLSNPDARNPSLRPDVAGLYVVRLKATNAAGAICIRTLEVTALQAGVAILTSPREPGAGPFQLTLIGQTNLTYTLQVSSNLTTWSDWTNVNPVTAFTPLTDPAPGQAHRFYRARVP